MKRLALIVALLASACRPSVGERALDLSCRPQVVDPPIISAAQQWKRLYQKVETKGTYTQVWGGDTGKLDPTTIDLARLNVGPGDYVGLQSSGMWFWGHDTSPQGPTTNRLGAVFTDAKGHFLLPGKSGQETRFETGLTCPGNVDQEMVQDFAVAADGETIVRVPKGATHLKFSTGDCFYGDNSPKGDFGVIIFEPNRKSAEPTPLAALAADGDPGEMFDKAMLDKIFAEPLPEARFFSRNPFSVQPIDDLPSQWRGNYRGNGWKPLRSSYSGKRDNRHWGWDIFAPLGTPLVAPVWPSKMVVPPESSYGKVAAFAFKYRGRKLLIAYGHLDRLSGGARPINGPDVVGYAGCSGLTGTDAIGCGKRFPNGPANGMRNDHVHVGFYNGVERPADSDNIVCDPRTVLNWTIR